MNPSQNNLCAKYEIVSAQLVTNEHGAVLKNSMFAGTAVQFEGESHYVVRLNMFPSVPYYLIKNRDSESYYTIYSKRVRNDESGAVRFQNPVGSGKLLSETKSHLEILFPLIGVSVFMNLYSRK